MIDPVLLRSEPDRVRASQTARGEDVGLVDAAIDADASRRLALAEYEQLRSEQNAHSKLVAQANAYMNATWAVAVAKAGVEDGSGLIGNSCIVDPNGRIVVEAQSLEDEIIVADCDFDMCRQGKDKIFNFAAHRRLEAYRLIVEQVGVIEPQAEAAIRDPAEVSA